MTENALPQQFLAATLSGSGLMATSVRERESALAVMALIGHLSAILTGGHGPSTSTGMLNLPFIVNISHFLNR